MGENTFEDLAALILEAVLALLPYLNLGLTVAITSITVIVVWGVWSLGRRT